MKIQKEIANHLFKSFRIGVESNDVTSLSNESH